MLKAAAKLQAVLDGDHKPPQALSDALLITADRRVDAEQGATFRRRTTRHLAHLRQYLRESAQVHETPCAGIVNRTPNIRILRRNYCWSSRLTPSTYCLI